MQARMADERAERLAQALLQRQRTRKAQLLG